MKRPILVLALPLLLAVVWWSNGSGGVTATAEVRIDTTEVIRTRTDVLERIGAVGGFKTDESTDFAEGGSSEMTFRVPLARLDDALTAVRTIDGVTVSQEVDVDDLVRDGDSIADDLAGLDTCLTALEDEIGRGDVRARVAQCQERLATAGDRLDRVAAPAEDVAVQVVVNRRSTTSPALLVGVGVLVAALGTLVVMTLRSRPSPVVDLSELERDATLEHLYQRRN